MIKKCFIKICEDDLHEFLNSLFYENPWLYSVCSTVLSYLRKNLTDLGVLFYVEEDTDVSKD